MRLTFEYELSERAAEQAKRPPVGAVVSTVRDSIEVERQIGRSLIGNLSVENCARLVHTIMTRDASESGGSVRPFETWWREDVLDVEPVASSTRSDESVVVPFPEESGGDQSVSASAL